MAHTPIVVREKYFDNGVITDLDGRIVHNVFQADEPVFRREYSDGFVDVISAKDRRVIMPRYHPTEMREYPPACQHCGQRPW